MWYDAYETVIHPIPSTNKYISIVHSPLFSDGQYTYHKANCKHLKTSEVKLFLKDNNLYSKHEKRVTKNIKKRQQLNSKIMWGLTCLNV